RTSGGRGRRRGWLRHRPTPRARAGSEMQPLGIQRTGPCPVSQGRGPPPGGRGPRAAGGGREGGGGEVEKRRGGRPRAGGGAVGPRRGRGGAGGAGNPPAEEAAGRQQPRELARARRHGATA